MDPFKLLSRSSKLSRSTKERSLRSTPSSGRPSQPQLFGAQNESEPSRFSKRKRGQEDPKTSHRDETTLQFFDNVNRDDSSVAKLNPQQKSTDGSATEVVLGKDGGQEDILADVGLPLEERRRIFKQHKLKVTWLNPQLSLRSNKRSKNQRKKVNKVRNALFPNPLQSLRDLRSRYGVSNRLSGNVADQGYIAPTDVQLAALPLLLDESKQYLPEVDSAAGGSLHDSFQIDLLTVAPTGSGKTLAFMIPLLHSLLSRRRRETARLRHTSAIILAPTKELASQITNEGKKLAKGTGLTISQMRKGMKLPESSLDYGIDGNHGDEDQHGTVIKADVVVSTPGVLQGLVSESQNPTWQIQQLVLDEADVLLDPMFREQTLAIWNSLTEPELRVSLWSATMGSNIEELARSTIKERLERLKVDSGVELAQAPLIRLVVGLKDSAVPNVQHKLTYAATERGKLMELRQLLHPVSSSTESGPALRPPFLVFTQTIERAIALHSELLYDIPAEAGGSSRISVLHSDLSDATRDGVMTRFRKGEIWVLITTDLLSRGVDFRGVNGVVNYDIPTSSAAYVHRIGRTGRAGRDGGVAVTLYSKEDIPYLKHVANVVSMAQKQKGADTGLHQWLLDALPRLSKNEKQNLKKRGIESRTARGQQKDPKAARKSRISTKAGFVRRAENKRKGAILGSRRRKETDAQSDEGEETDFGGFE